MCKHRSTEKELSAFIMNADNSRYEIQRKARELFNLLNEKDWGGKRKWFSIGQPLKQNEA